MPNIREYSAPDRSPQPTDRVLDTAREVGMLKDRFSRQTGEALGSAVANIGRQFGEAADRHVEAQWISHGAVVNSSLFSDLTAQWNHLASSTDPNDTSIAQGFKEHVLEPSLDKFVQSFEGAPEGAQNWAMQRADQLRQHFFEKVGADMSTRAGTAATQNIDTTVRNYSQAAYADPSALPQIDVSINHDFDGIIQSHGLTAEQAARIRGEVLPKALENAANSAFYGLANKNPDGAKAAAAAGQFDKYWDAEQKEKALRYAETVKRAQQEDENRAYELQKRQENDLRKKTADGYISAIISGQGVSAKKVAADPNLGPEERENIIRFQTEHTRQIREERDNIPHPVEYRSLLNDLFQRSKDDPNNLTVQPIRDAFKAGKLNPTEEAQLEARFNNLDKPLERNFHNQMIRVERAISSSPIYGPMSSVNPGKLQMALTQIENDAYGKLDAARNKGEDVTPLLDPASPKYLFKPDVIKSYLTDSQTGLKEAAGTVQRGKVFATAAELDAAVKAGTVKSGDRITVNGQSGVWH